MAPQVIDLRKSPPARLPDAPVSAGGFERRDTPQQGEEQPHEVLSENPAPTQHKPDMIEWQAREYEAREHGPYWFIGTGAVAVVFVILGILARSWFFIAFIALAYVTLALYAKRHPREMHFALTKDGIGAGTKFYRSPDLKSFWILDTPEGKVLSLETDNMLSPYVRLPMGNLNPESIRQQLQKMIPEKEHKEFLTDHIARGIGL